MKADTEASPHHLLSCFFTECEKQFRFLELKHGFSYFSGLVEYVRGRQVIKPYYNQAVIEPFWAVTRYEKENIALEILYGDESFDIEGYAYYNRTHRLSWEEILGGAKKDNKNVNSVSWAAQPSIISAAVRAMSSTAQDYFKTLTEPSEKSIERALTMRSKRMEQSIFEQYKKSMDHAVKMAAVAFVEKNYRRVIEIYTPYEQHLSTADLKKLQLARKKILEELTTR